MKLVIAEKPSVAQSLAHVIGATKPQDGYLEGNGYLVSWCVGHLVELSAPERYDERFAKWRLEDLLSGKKAAYAEYRKLRDEAQELSVAVRNIASLYEAELQEQQKIKEEKTH